MKTLATRAWQWLGSELDAWAEQDNSANFWWRDDDATEPTQDLARLVNLSETKAVPLALAVIPGKLKPGLQDFLNHRHLISVLQHGYMHDNNAMPGQRKLELGGNRDHNRLMTDLKLGREILRQHFHDRFVPVLVPPWNRIDSALVSRLNDLNFAGISTMKVRRNAYPAADLLQVNTHLDPVNWRHNGGFIGVYPAIAILIQHLQAKRTGYRDAEEPTGILTHHQAQNEAVWRFIEELLQFLSRQPAVSWLDAPAIWQ